MAKRKTRGTTQETRQKLIQAAGEIFAAHGLHGATIQQITHLAGVNQAAINYHFSDKFRLYEEVVGEAYRDGLILLQQVPLPGASPQHRLRAYVGLLLENLLMPGRPAWKRLLVCREFTQPSSLIGQEIRVSVRQHIEMLHGIIRELLPHAPESLVITAVCSLLGQCVFMANDRSAIEYTYPEITQHSIAELAEQMSDLILLGLNGVAGG